MSTLPAALWPVKNPSDTPNMRVTVETDIGVTGVGEGGSKDTLEPCAGTLIGKDLSLIEAIWQGNHRGWLPGFWHGRRRFARWINLQHARDGAASDPRMPPGRRACHGIEEFEPYFVEDPVRGDHVHQDISKLPQLTAVPLTHGEEWGQRWHFNRL